jgi:hypothetical protein
LKKTTQVRFQQCSVAFRRNHRPHSCIMYYTAF